MLIVEDETGVRSTLELLFEEAGYTAHTSATGHAAVQMAAQIRPNLAVLDWNLPDLSGLEVARCIKEHPLTYHTAIILVTARTSLDDRLSGLEFADDFICKPFETHELLARARAVRRRSARALGCNPLTGLPGNLAIEETLAQMLHEGESATVVMADLDHFKPFNDHYGYERGDNVLAFTAQLLWEQLGQLKEDWFLGHVGGDDFLFIVPSAQLSAVTDAILKRFDEGILHFYDQQDLSEDGFIAHDRQGNPARYGRLALTLGAVPVSPGQFANPAELSVTVAQAKAKGKAISGSCLVIQQPGEPPFDRRKRK